MRNVASLLALLVLVAGGCGGATAPSDVVPCGPYPDQATSLYVLPYPVGDTHTVYQGNCGLISHLVGTSWKYAYDFRMVVGSIVVATAAGQVVRVVESFPNSTLIPEEENYIIIAHGVGRYSHYSHLDQGGAFVEVGQQVQQGQPLGRSGVSGTPIAHLHFQVYYSNQMTVPVTFRNTRPHPNGLVQGEAYTAEPF